MRGGGGRRTRAPRSWAPGRSRVRSQAHDRVSTGRHTGQVSTPDPKTCASCGRTIEWRAKWARDWDQVRYCSTACRKRGVRPADRALERSILDLLDARGRTTTICPSDAARAVAASETSGTSGTAGDEAWRELMEPARRAARRLVAAGEVEITQGGRVVDPSHARGAIRIRRVRGG